jgi:hypothetical protein
MTKAAAIHSFFNSFGLEAYEETSVHTLPTAPLFPYITYELITDGNMDSKIPFTISLWYRSKLWVNANAKAEEISKAISSGGIILDFDEGHIWITRNSPFAQRMGDESDDMVKRIILNLSAEFWAEN